MHLPHPLLTLPAAAAVWLLAGVCQYETPSAQASPDGHNPLAVRRSAYGSLVARLMKDSLHSYWHAGCTDHTHGHAVPPGAHPANCTDPTHGHAVPAGSKPQVAAAPSPAGRFSRRNPAAANPAPPSSVAPAPESWLARASKDISRLEHMRTARNSPFAVAPAHRRFLSASADWRVHIAWQLDPGDAALYEIDHFTVLSRATSAESAKKAVDELAVKTIHHALSPQAGLADALTGAGAAINVLNDKMRPGHPAPPKTDELVRDWRVLTFCLRRHDELRQQADEEDWWSEIPEVRRKELDTYATMLTRLSSMIHQKLAANGTLTSGASQP